MSLLLLSHKHIESGDRTILICSLSTDRHQSFWSESLDLLNLYNLFTGRCQCQNRAIEISNFMDLLLEVSGV